MTIDLARVCLSIYLSLNCRAAVETAAASDRPSMYQPWAPSAYTAFKALLSVRLCAAIWSNISDCDETYNYWEPVCTFVNIKVPILNSDGNVVVHVFIFVFVQALIDN